MARSRRRVNRDLMVRNVGAILLVVAFLGMVYAFIGPSIGWAGLVRHGVNGVSALLLASSFGCFGVFINMGSHGAARCARGGISASTLAVNALFVGLTCLGLFIGLTTLSDVVADVQEGPCGVKVSSYEEALERNGSARNPSFTPDEYEVDLFERLGDDVPVAHISVKRSDWARVLEQLTDAQMGSTVWYYPRTQVFMSVEA